LKRRAVLVLVLQYRRILYPSIVAVLKGGTSDLPRKARYDNHPDFDDDLTADLDISGGHWVHRVSVTDDALGGGEMS
jgi:hypothetical protein